MNRAERGRGHSAEPVDQTHWKEFACGWGAAVCNISLTYPVNKIIFRQMLHGVHLKSAFQQVYHEGIYYLYRGMLPPLIQKTTSMSLMFGVYDECRKPLMQTGLNIYVVKIIAGVVAGTVEATLMPFERVVTVLSDSLYHDKYQNTAHAFRTIYREHGAREFYRGLVPILLRNGPSNACFFIMRDAVNDRLPKTRSGLKDTLAEFVAGALIGVILSAVFYPLNVLKVATQRRVGGEFEGMRAVMMRTYRERGSRLGNLYHGLGTNCTRAFLSWGVINAAYENLKKVMY